MAFYDLTFFAIIVFAHNRKKRSIFKCHIGSLVFITEKNRLQIWNHHKILPKIGCLHLNILQKRYHISPPSICCISSLYCRFSSFQIVLLYFSADKTTEYFESFLLLFMHVKADKAMMKNIYHWSSSNYGKSFYNAISFSGFCTFHKEFWSF